MSFDIALFLAQDGVTVGAIYALLAIALVLVFTVTRIIFIPQGEFVSYGALTLAALRTERVPGTIWLLLLLTVVVVARDVWRASKRRIPGVASGCCTTLTRPRSTSCGRTGMSAPDGGHYATGTWLLR